MAINLRLYHGKPCHWCRRPMMRESEKWRPTRDHVIPKAVGGTIIRVACHACNNLKGDMPAPLWIETLERFPAVHDLFGKPGPRGMALFYSLFGNVLAPHIERIAAEVSGRHQKPEEGGL